MLFCNTFKYSCIVCSPLFTTLYGSTFFSHVAWTLSLSEILCESILMFSVGVTKVECWMSTVLVRCDVPAPVKVSLWKSPLSTIWLPGLPTPSSGGQTDAFSRSQLAHQTRRWRISAYLIPVCRKSLQVLYFSWCHEGKDYCLSKYQNNCHLLDYKKS